MAWSVVDGLVTMCCVLGDVVVCLVTVDLSVWCGVGFQGQYGDAEELYKRCQAIQEKALGADHPDLAATLYSRAVLLVRQVSTTGVVDGGSREPVGDVRGVWGMGDPASTGQARRGTPLFCVHEAMQPTPTSDMTSRVDHGMVGRGWSGHDVLCLG